MKNPTIFMTLKQKGTIIVIPKPPKDDFDTRVQKAKSRPGYTKKA